MNRNRRLSMVGATLAGLISVTALTGAASASADTLAPTKAPAGSTSVPLKPADPLKPVVPLKPAEPATGSRKTAEPAVDVNAAHRARTTSQTDRTLAKVKAAVLKAYPKATINSVRVRDGGGWRVTLVTHAGHKGTVTVDKHFSVGRLVLAQARQHQSA